MRVLVCGGRDFADFTAVCDALNTYAYEADLVIHGGGRGTDYLAGEWAEHHQIPVRIFPADWDKHGHAAGPIRNRQMLVEGKPDLVVAFPGGQDHRSEVITSPSCPSR